MEIADRDGVIVQRQEMWILCDKAAAIYGKETGQQIGKWIGGREGCDEEKESVRRRSMWKEDGCAGCKGVYDETGRER